MAAVIQAIAATESPIIKHVQILTQERTKTIKRNCFFIIKSVEVKESYQKLQVLVKTFFLY